MTAATSTPTEQELQETLAALWWMPLIRGILLIFFGILMFSQPGSTLISLIWFLGVYWIVDGVFSLIEGVRGHAEKSRVWMFIGGIVSIIGGFFIVGNPIMAGVVSGSLLVYLIGFTTIVSGVMMIFAGRDGQWTLWGMIMGILYIIFGVFIVTHPVMTLATLVILLPIWAIVSGVFAIGLAFMLRGSAA